MVAVEAVEVVIAWVDATERSGCGDFVASGAPKCPPTQAAPLCVLRCPGDAAANVGKVAIPPWSAHRQVSETREAAGLQLMQHGCGVCSRRWVQARGSASSRWANQRRTGPDALLEDHGIGAPIGSKRPTMLYLLPSLLHVRADVLSRGECSCRESHRGAFRSRTGVCTATWRQLWVPLVADPLEAQLRRRGGSQ